MILLLPVIRSYHSLAENASRKNRALMQKRGPFIALDNILLCLGSRFDFFVGGLDVQYARENMTAGLNDIFEDPHIIGWKRG